MTSETFGSLRFQRAMECTGAELLGNPIKHGSFYSHAIIARGGQGTVFLATGDDRARSRVCVLKTFVDSQPDALNRAQRSVETQLALLNSASEVHVPMYPRDEQIRPAPWIPDILAWDLGAATPWVAQDFRGPNLRRALSNRPAESIAGHLPDKRDGQDLRTWLLSQVVSAVEFVHMHGVVHRDLKPDNILVERVDAHHLLTESVALCDFDLSKPQGRTSLTQSAVGMGTLGYSAPEQLFVSARDVTAAADVYAVAMLTIFLTTGREPAEAMSGPDLMHLRLDPRVASELGSKRPWVERALSFMPEDRPPLSALHPALYGPAAGA